jgi:hypothetical protein
MVCLPAEKNFHHQNRRGCRTTNGLLDSYLDGQDLSAGAIPHADFLAASVRPSPPLDTRPSSRQTVLAWLG